MALPRTIDLQIVTPERQVFSGQVQQVTIPGEEGALGIMPGHAPLISKLGVGVLSLLREGHEAHMYCSYGFVEVLPDAVSVLADHAYTKEELNLQQAKEEMAEAEQRLRASDREDLVEEARRQYYEAMAKLEVLKR